MNMANKQDPNRQISRAVARLHAGILALIFGAICGLGLFVMTAWLVVKGGPRAGLHLELLHHYFIGYSVTWPGAFVGLGEGGLFGALFGWIIGIIYNRIVGLRTVRWTANSE